MANLVSWAKDREWAHRDYVTPGNTYDTGYDVFKFLIDQGLRSEHKLCDVGCGSLRVGRYLLTHLEHGCYYAIEPNRWLVDAAIDKEIGTLAEIKKAHFDFGRTDFDVNAAFPDVRFDFILISAVLIHASHAQIKRALYSTYKRGDIVLFDTFPQGPDHDGDWIYPQIAPHYDDCVFQAVPMDSILTKLHIDERGAQWWRLARG